MAVTGLRGLSGLAYGADYNPDQWPEELWTRDAELMAEAGVNLVTLPVFGWPGLERTPGTYEFGWLDRVIAVLWERGIRVDLATATATPPSWLVRAHPEVLPVNAEGVRLEFGSRQTYCPSSPVFAEHALRMCRELARHYAEHPALAMWHVSNEYGDELSRCWCPESARHFRRWLRDRYGTLTELNRAWGTACWGQNYIEWDHIEVPRATTGPGNPAQLLDFERFSSDAFLALFDAEIAVLREITPDVPITTNFMGTFRQLDYWRFAGREDIVSNDAYPDPADPDCSRTAALGCSLMRSLKGGRPWLLLEQAPSAVSWRPVNVPKPPGLMRLHSMQALAHGADGVMFFQWRAARVGAERFHSAMVGHRGAVGRTWTECKDLGRELASLAELNGSRVRARVALMIDWDCWWALDPAGSLPSTRLDWLQQLRDYHAALFDLGVCADLVPPDGDTSRYDAIIVPNWFLAKDADAQRMSAYVRDGGQVLVGPFGGVVDECAQVHLGGGPGPLRELLGVAVDEYWPLADGTSVAVDLSGPEPTAAREWTEVLECTSAEPIGWYRGGSADGHPALTRKRTGRGSARYLGAVLEPGGLRHVIAGLLADAGVPASYDSEQTVEVVTRTGPRADYTFVLNHREQPARYEFSSPARELLTGAEVDTALRLPPFGVAILKRARADHAGANQNQPGDQ